MTTGSKIVARYKDGRRIKGFTSDFAPNRDRFHVAPPDDEHKTTEVIADELKAIFYVKSFEGKSDHSAEPDFTRKSLEGVPGLKLKITFSDGEVMFGTTLGYTPGRKGFFIQPADKESNNDRVYVFSAATTDVETWR